MKPATKITIGTIPAHTLEGTARRARYNAQTHAGLALHYYAEAERRYRLGHSPNAIAETSLKRGHEHAIIAARYWALAD